MGEEVKNAADSLTLLRPLFIHCRAHLTQFLHRRDECSKDLDEISRILENAVCNLRPV